jgi:hypothetical protein
LLRKISQAQKLNNVFRCDGGREGLPFRRLEEG